MNEQAKGSRDHDPTGNRKLSRSGIVIGLLVMICGAFVLYFYYTGPVRGTLFTSTFGYWLGIAWFFLGLIASIVSYISFRRHYPRSRRRTDRALKRILDENPPR